uniref:Type 2 lantibiotic n=1 Tax=Caldicellulosiruptor owensensis TaxID=55205 RepID=A0A7C5V2E0_9FIRM
MVEVCKKNLYGIAFEELEEEEMQELTGGSWDSVARTILVTARATSLTCAISASVATVVVTIIFYNK